MNPLSAKEMFEELGYVKMQDHFYTINYWKGRNETIYSHIDFDLNNKTVIAIWWDENQEIDMPTFKAIQKQLEELGWI